MQNNIKTQLQHKLTKWSQQIGQRSQPERRRSLKINTKDK